MVKDGILFGVFMLDCSSHITQISGDYTDKNIVTIKVSHVHLTPEAMAIIVRLAQKEFPNEVCGFLIGDAGDLFLPERRITAVISAENTTVDRTNSYKIDPREWRKAEAHAQCQNQAILGIYHSHPNGSATPSKIDTESAWPELIYLIVAIGVDGVKDICAWCFDLEANAWKPIKVQVRLG